ncbi:hypothetical protein SEA_YOSIF_29 [Streptomyces phage Yosif]|uniref:Uncharacterized protein n=1 Tax=Streptomyces phage Yosif TaxID=2201421 RepID=A0A2Z4QC80_9CAUD|nr:hypothetical protein KGG71_gp29 [Streptomyces phage Yosif]AWY07593.1 hypothetical protein SEA_YOSIF_29 [Streptomyces phage Yosif]
MGKHAKAKASVLISLLPHKYQRKGRAVLGSIALLASVGAVFYADEPRVAVALQALTALGLLHKDGSPVSEDEL